MHTITTVRIGPPSTGRTIRRSMRSPPRNARTSVAKNAVQYGNPAFSSDHARYVLNIAISPWA